MYHFTNSLLVLLLAAIPLPAYALDTDKQQPIKVQANSATISKTTGTSTYYGNVVVEQGSMRIMTETLRVNTSEGKLKSMVAEGKPVKFQQRTTDDKKNISAVANKMIYHADTNIVVFENKASLTQGPNKFASNRITYNIARETVDAGKSSGGGRVTITIDPAANPGN